MKLMTGTALSASLAAFKSSVLSYYLSRFSNKSERFSSSGETDIDMLSFLMKECGVKYPETEGEICYQDTECLLSISTEEQAVEALRRIWPLDLIELQERLYAIFLDKDNRLLGIKLISIGNTNIKTASPCLITSTAAELAASKIIVAHNHPSGINKASASDREYTNLLNERCKEDSLTLVNHLIITRKDYCSISFA